MAEEQVEFYKIPAQFVGKPKPKPELVFKGSGAEFKQVQKAKAQAKAQAEAEAKAKAEAEALKQQQLSQQKAQAQAEAEKKKQTRTQRVKAFAKKTISGIRGEQFRQLPQVQRAKQTFLSQPKQVSSTAIKEATSETKGFGFGDVTTLKAKEQLSIGAGGEVIQKKFTGPTGQKVGKAVSIVEKGVAPLFPGTRSEVLTDVALSTAFVGSPKIVKGVVSAGFVGGGARVISKATTPEQKVTGGILLGGGLVGLGAEFTPFVRGGIAKVSGAKSPKFQKTPTETSLPKPIGPKLFGPERQAVKVGGTDIGIVPEGKGFGFSQAEQLQQVGTKGVITSFQRGLLKTGQTEFTVTPGSERKGVFFTPTPTELGGGARISRGGFVEGIFETPSLKAEAGIPALEKPQIIFQKDAKIENIGFKGTSELETTIPPGRKLLLEPQRPVVIKGQKVEVFEIKGQPVKEVGAKDTTRITGSIGGLTQDFRRTSVTTGKVTPLPTIITKPTQPTSTPTVPKISSTSITTKASSPVSPPTTKGISPTIPPSIPPSAPISPSIPLKSVALPKTTPSRPLRLPQIPVSPPAITSAPTSFKPRGKKKKRRGVFTVEGRRFGEFTTIGRTSDLQRAIGLGKEFATGTLGATFRIRGAKLGSVRTPKGFRTPRQTSQLKAPLTFIEKRKFRLSRPGEKTEIRKAKTTKSRRK